MSKMLDEKKIALAQLVQQTMERTEKARQVENPCESCPVGGGCINVVCRAREEAMKRTR